MTDAPIAFTTVPRAGGFLFVSALTRPQGEIADMAARLTAAGGMIFCYNDEHSDEAFDRRVRAQYAATIWSRRWRSSSSCGMSMSPAVIPSACKNSRPMAG